jgi:hypothetical protein
MPELFESNVFDPATTAVMRSALETAMIKCKPSRADYEQAQHLIASAIIDIVNDGEWRRDKIIDQALALYAVALNIERSR